MPHARPSLPVSWTGEAFSTQSPAICGVAGSAPTVKAIVSVISPPLHSGVVQLTGITTVATYPVPFGVASNGGAHEPGAAQCSTVQAPGPSHGPVSVHVRDRTSPAVPKVGSGGKPGGGVTLTAVRTTATVRGPGSTGGGGGVVVGAAEDDVLVATGAGSSFSRFTSSTATAAAATSAPAVSARRS